MPTSTVIKVQGGFEIFAPEGYFLVANGGQSYLVHTAHEAAVIAAGIRPCEGEDELERSRR